MRVKPGSTHGLFEEWGVTGATLGVRLDSTDGTTVVARTTGFVEGATTDGIYYLDEFTFPDDAGDYVLVFNDDGTTYDAAHVSTRSVVVTSSAPDSGFDGDTFAEATELFRILKIANPSAAQETAADRVLIAAAGEITRAIGEDGVDALDGSGVALCAQVNLERAAELWKLQEIQFGVLELAGDFGATRIGRDTWLKHEITLSRLALEFGFA